MSIHHNELCVNSEIYQKPFPHFGRPRIIGYIDIENLKYAQNIRNCEVSFDLNEQINNVIRKPADLDVKLTELLKFLLDHQHRLKLQASNKIESATIFCYRGLMTCVACTPYENRDPWKIVAILFKGNIYLCARDTEEKKMQKKNMTVRDLMFSSWGYKFEQYVVSDSPQTDPTPEMPVNEMEEFSLVLKTNINRHNIVFGAEMDGIRCDKECVQEKPDLVLGPEALIQYLSSKEFIEIKTSRHIETSNQDRNFRRFKAKKWWCQSFLVGIDTILCGFRNDDGIVERLKTYRVADLPKMSKKFWDPNVCFNFLDTFFTYVKRCLYKEIKLKFGEMGLNNLHSVPLTGLLFEWKPGCNVRVNRNYRHEDDQIIPDVFINNYGKYDNCWDDI
ncbi:decapping nuclease DXO homolog [Leptidea sinapis]|uniref:decapping nuclease DXO homolog n=1 Tax=Leptidea sinapis TaxID=189913 RepID=UPI0021250EEE|nr:decapping nuclease DXO homolog [Leptidea sinapis]